MELKDLALLSNGSLRGNTLEEMAKRKGMNIMLLAGKGHENYQIVGSKRNKFDDRETLLSLTRS